MNTWHEFTNEGISGPLDIPRRWNSWMMYLFLAESRRTPAGEYHPATGTTLNYASDNYLWHLVGHFVAKGQAKSK